MELHEIAERVEKIGLEIQKTLSSEIADRQYALEKIETDLYRLWSDIVKAT